MDAGRRLRHGMVAAALVVLAASPGVRADSQARDILVEDLNGVSVHPFSETARAWVFVFTRTDCPVAARYAPELQRLQQQARSAHVAFHLVFVNPAEAPAAVRAYLRDYGYDGRALRDPSHRLVRLAGVTTTPEAAAFTPSGDGPVLAYRGRIDDRYVDIAHTRPAPTRHDLEEILAAIGAGRRLELRTTPAVGCLIADVAQ